jgi:RNA polymerase sigma-70 factor (ECF subfamily)
MAADRASGEAVAGRPADLPPSVLAAAFRGDEAAFTRVVERYQGPVYRLCRRFVAEADAEDAAQETFVRAFVHRADYEAGRPILPWLLAIARRLCIDRLRRAGRERVVDDGEAADRADPGADAEELAASRETLERLAAGLEALPEGQREALVLFHAEALSYRDVARTLGVPQGTVMTWLHRGRARLRTLLGRAERRAS